MYHIVNQSLNKMIMWKNWNLSNGAGDSTDKSLGMEGNRASIGRKEEGSEVFVSNDSYGRIEEVPENRGRQAFVEGKRTLVLDNG